MAEKTAGLIRGIDNIKIYDNTPAESTGVTELSLTGLPKGVYFVNAHQLIQSNNQEVVYARIYINDVQQNDLSSEYGVTSGSWKGINTTYAVEIANNNSTLKVSFNRTVYQASLRAYKIG